MSKKTKLKVSKPVGEKTVSAPPPSIAQPQELCSPQWISKARIFLLVAAIAFLGLRLWYLSWPMASWDDAGAIDTIAHSGKETSTVVLMRQWSYAPAQFFLTRVLVGFAHDYYSLLFWGRLPSLLIWAVTLVASFQVFRSLLGREYFALSMALTIWTAVTWRGLIESSQGYNYVCGYPAAVLLMWLFVSERGFGWLTEPKQLWRPAAVGCVVGLMCWATYQSVFVAAGGFLLVGIAALWRKNFQAFKGIIVGGLAFSLMFWFVYAYSLKYVQSRGGSWARGLPGESLKEKFTFLPMAWMEVLESAWTFVPPRAGSIAVVCVLLAIVIWGGWRFIKARRNHPVELRLLGFVLIMALIWSVAAYAKIFPLSPTRHTYILQFPLIVMVGLAVKYLHVSRRGLVIASVVIVGAFLATAPNLLRTVRNNFDVAKIRSLLGEGPDTVLLGYRGGSCLDYLLLLTERPEWRQRMADGTWNWGGYMQSLAGAPPRLKIYTVGVQAPITQESIDICRTNGFKVTAVEEIPATGCIEPWRQDSYIPNSFYLYQIERNP